MKTWLEAMDDECLSDEDLRRYMAPGKIEVRKEAEFVPPKANHDQPAPIPNDKPAMWHVVIMDMLNRDHVGRERYKTQLQPHNGRDALSDAYQEALDLAVYLRQAIFERDGK